MSRRGVAVAAIVAAAAAAAGAAAWLIVTYGSRPEARSPIRRAYRAAGDEAALARLNTIPLYRALVDTKTIRRATLDDDGTVHVDVDLRALAEPRLAAFGAARAAEALPPTAAGTILIDPGGSGKPAMIRHESWDFSGPAPLLALFDRSSTVASEPRLWESLPHSPAAVVYVRLRPSQLSDPALLGTAFASWSERIDIAEKLLGRPIRAELSEDLAGPAAFALYELAGASEAEGLAAFSLKRSDRLAGLLDTIFGLGALTERATVARYRGVLTGSFVPAAGGPGLALAVDGNVLWVASSRLRLESAIDARRAPIPDHASPLDGHDASGSWGAVSTSSFVSRGWSRIARASDEPVREAATVEAKLTPEGADGWRLAGGGPTPAITADPIVPFFRSVLARRQRDGG